MITFVLCVLAGYSMYRASEHKYSPGVNMVAGLITCFGLYGFIHWVGIVYDFLFGPQFTLLRFLATYNIIQ